jgi:hypothetical protein
MKIAYIIYDGMSALELTAVSEPLARLKMGGFLPGLEWELCALSPEVRDQNGVRLLPSQTGEPLHGYDLVVVPGGDSAPDLAQDGDFIEWLKSAADCPLAPPPAQAEWRQPGLERTVESGGAGAIDLGSGFRKLAGGAAKIRLQMGDSGGSLL